MTRRELTHIVCTRLLAEHSEIEKLLAGFRKPKQCGCNGCVAARELEEAYDSHSQH
jgi:hypothetical protein